MLLSYGELLSPFPIRLSIGIIRKPVLREIARIGFDRFNAYEAFLKCTPKHYYTKMMKDHGGIEMWESMSDAEREELTMCSLIGQHKDLQTLYTQIFEFFFEEFVRFEEGFFILYYGEIPQDEKIPLENIQGIISEQNFSQVVDIIQQVCCIHSKADESAEDLKFKNEFARKMYEKMQKALKKQEEEKESKYDKDMSLPNIISALASNHPSINLHNIWDLTLFQLFDSFKRIQIDRVYDIDATRVSVWGDEKKQFKPDLWYKNHHDS